MLCVFLTQPESPGAHRIHAVKMREFIRRVTVVVSLGSAGVPSFAVEGEK